VAWSPDREELLRELVVDGHSYSEAAARVSAVDPHLGTLSRNAAIGKALRLGIAKSRPNYVAKPRRTPGKTKPRKLLSPEHVALAQMRREAFRAEPDIVVPENERRGVLDLESGDCRWPIGDPKEPGFHFCNRLQVGTQSRNRSGVSRYCEFHLARSSDGPAVRRRRMPDAAPTRQREDMEAA
jgi:GcrA cell cycle regulator